MDKSTTKIIIGILALIGTFFAAVNYSNDIDIINNITIFNSNDADPTNYQKTTPAEPIKIPEPTQTVGSSNPEIVITYPSTDSKVHQYETIEGTSQNIPDGYQIWVLGYSDSGRYYPRPESKGIQENGKWDIEMDIGTESDSGVSYDIIVMLADAEANEIFDKYATTYTQSGEWPIVTEKPDGAIEYDKIRVTRI